MASSEIITKENMRGFSEVLTFPHIQPEKGVRSYLHSKNKDKHQALYLNEISINDPTFNSIQIQKLHSIQLEENLTKLLQRKKSEDIPRRIYLDKKWKQFKLFEAAFQKNFKDFNAFITQNQAKKKRLAQNITVLSTITANREKQIESLKHQYDYLLGIKNQMEEKLKEMSMYEDYLHTVCHVTAEFIEPDDIVRRYEAILISEEIIKTIQEENRLLLDQYRNMSTKMINEKTEQLRYLNLHLATMITRFKEARMKSSKWEKVFANILYQSSFIKKQNIHTKMGCQSIYHTLVKRNNPKILLDKTDYEGQLEYIKKCLGNLEKISKIINIVVEE